MPIELKKKLIINKRVSNRIRIPVVRNYVKHFVLLKSACKDKYKLKPATRECFTVRSLIIVNVFLVGFVTQYSS